MFTNTIEIQQYQSRSYKAGLLKIMLVALMLVVLSQQSEAKKVNGFIVTNQNDTIAGMFRLPQMSVTNAGFLIRGFDVEALQYMVTFKGNNEKRFKTYEPGASQSFSFTHDSAVYLYRSLNIERKSIVVNEQSSSRFLTCLYDGRISLYRNMISNHMNVNNGSGYARFEEYFLNHKAGALVLVKTDVQSSSMKEILRQSGVEDEFLQKLPDTISFKNLLTILASYDEWLASSKK